MSFTIWASSFCCMNSLCPGYFSNMLLWQVVLVLYLVSLSWTEALFFYLWECWLLVTHTSSSGEFFLLMGTALSWELMLLSPLPITNDGAQLSNLLFLGWSVLFPHCLTGFPWKAVPQQITYVRLWIHQGKKALPKLLWFLSLMTEFPHSPSFLAHMCSNKKSEFFDCYLTEQCNYFLFPHIPFKQ